MCMMSLLFILHFLFVNGFQSSYPPLLIKEINLIRAHGCRCGDIDMMPVDSLIWNEDLEKTARQHAIDMTENDYFSHFDKNNQEVSNRAEFLEYEWIQIGENIARGFLSDFDVLKAWLESPTHCEMIMFPHITEMGAARVDDYWVANFGKPIEQSDSRKRKRKKSQNLSPLVSQKRQSPLQKN